MKSERHGRFRDWGPTLLRLTLGAVFLAHGGLKLADFGGTTAMVARYGIPFPALGNALSMLAELGGGILFLLGLWIRWAAIPLTVSLLVVPSAVHWPWGLFIQEAGYEYVLAHLVAIAALSLMGPGRLSLEGRLGRRR
ncbi:MAG: DoxX family protein [Nitrospinota bacterium]